MMDALSTKFDTLELPNNEGKPIGSGWYIKPIDNLPFMQTDTELD